MALTHRLASWLFASMLAASASAQSGVIGGEEEEQDAGVEEIVVTSMRVSPGGAQDANHFRGEVASSRIPHPNTLTAEGLLGAHDLVLPAARSCAQLLCLTGEAMPADLIAAPAARALAGIGFTTRLEQSGWRRDPVNVIAVVDKSGSMDGAPLELVRESLRRMLGALRPGDQLAIVLYGETSHVHLAPTPVSDRSRAEIHRSIGAIRSAGSTFMEDGLRTGYALARETAPGFRGRTRLILFTDERPNVGSTDAASFMGMAEAASRDGVGLTTIGVGVHFGAQLATRISSVRGGNLFFLRDEADAAEVFGERFDTLVSELAHDLRLTITPAAGAKISAVYGVPGELLGWQNEREIVLELPSVFLDTKGGGIFFTLAPDSGHAFLPERWRDGDAIARVALSYLPLGANEPETDAAELGFASEPSDGLALGHTLIDEFTVLHRATSAHYIENDQETAYQLVRALRGRLERYAHPGLAPERELVAALDAQLSVLSGHGVEGAAPPFAKLWGRWRIEHTGGRGVTSLRRGQVVEFSPHGDLRVFAKSGEELEVETYSSTNEQVYFDESSLMFEYWLASDGKLRLRHERANVVLRLVREG
ncbi:MAG: VWA domain-containing protein [Deltaproteobacteria bacterium]|nr:VWA domain-containing protein [Deltaproteobacteria bacterium]